MSQTKQASVEEIWNSNSKTFDSGYHNTHIDYMDKETFIKLLREYSQSKDREKVKAGLLFRVTAKNTFPDPTIFVIKSVNDNEVVVSWQDIHGRGERTTDYVLSDVKSKFKFGDWTEINPIDELTAKEAELKYWRELAEAADKVFSSYKEWTEACKDKTHSAFSVSLIYKIYTQTKEKYQSLKNQKQ